MYVTQQNLVIECLFSVDDSIGGGHEFLDCR